MFYGSILFFFTMQPLYKNHRTENHASILYILLNIIIQCAIYCFLIERLCITYKMLNFAMRKHCLILSVIVGKLLKAFTWNDKTRYSIIIVCITFAEFCLRTLFEIRQDKLCQLFTSLITFNLKLFCQLLQTLLQTLNTDLIPPLLFFCFYLWQASVPMPKFGPQSPL